MTDPVQGYRLLMADVYELAGLSRRISGRDAAERGATAMQWQVLSVLSESAETVPAIALRLGLTRQAIQRVVNELLARGHVRKHPADRSLRSSRFEATASGRKLLEQLWSANLPPRQRMLAAAAVDRDELDAARATLRRLIDALRASESRDRGRR